MPAPLQVQKGPAGQVYIRDHRGVIVLVLTKEQARSLADVLTAVTR